MATTRLIPMHRKKGQSAGATLAARLNYAENPRKTQGGEYLSGYGCLPGQSATDFMLVRQQYETVDGDNRGNVLAYQIRQSFKPGEITPEEAMRIGYELAMQFTKGRYQFIVATHTDKAHIHNHIIFNAVRMDCSGKFQNFWNSSRAVARISDLLCIQNGLSIVENPKEKSASYDKWLGDKKPDTWKGKLAAAIEQALAKHPKDVNTFLDEMTALGYEIKRGKHICFRAKEQTKFTRLRSLGDHYSEENLLLRIMKNKDAKAPTKKHTASPSHPSLPLDIQSRIRNMIDTQKGSPGYERWATIHNIKEAAKTLIYLQENGMDDMEKLSAQSAEASDEFHKITEAIRACESRLKSIAELQRSIADYRRTREVYAAYKTAKNPQDFRDKNIEAIMLHEAAKNTFNSLGAKKLPTIAQLRQEYASLLAKKKLLYNEYYPAKKRSRELLVAKVNTERLLGTNSTAPVMQNPEQNPPKR